jgi:ABC-2 type transport system permease protein
MNIFIFELKAYRKTNIVWTLSIIAGMFFFMALFPTFARDAEEMNKMLQAYPESVRKALGLTVDLATLLGYYSYVLLYVMLSGSIQAMNLGLSIISKEARHKTADFLLTKPVKRSFVLASKIAAAASSLALTSTCYVAAAYFTALLVKDGPFDTEIFFLLSLTLFFMQMIFLSLGFIAAVVFTRIKSVLSISLGTVFGFFIINMLGSVFGEKTLRYITPFKYFDFVFIIKNGSYEFNFLILGALVTAAAFSLSFIIYSKKDINTV